MINIQQVSVKTLKELRPLLPIQEYKLLKNRKSARETRKKRKELATGVSEQLMLYQQENAYLRKHITMLEARVSSAEQALRKMEPRESHGPEMI